MLFGFHRLVAASLSLLVTVGCAKKHHDDSDSKEEEAPCVGLNATTCDAALAGDVTWHYDGLNVILAMTKAAGADLSSFRYRPHQFYTFAPATKVWEHVLVLEPLVTGTEPMMEKRTGTFALAEDGRSMVLTLTESSCPAGETSIAADLDAPTRSLDILRDKATMQLTLMQTIPPERYEAEREPAKVKARNFIEAMFGFIIETFREIVRNIVVTLVSPEFWMAMLTGTMEAPPNASELQQQLTTGLTPTCLTQERVGTAGAGD